MPEQARGNRAPNIALAGQQSEHSARRRPRLRLITNNVSGRMSEDALGSWIEDTPDFPASPAEEDVSSMEDSFPIERTYPSFSERRSRRRIPVTVTSSVWLDVSARAVSQTTTLNLTSGARGTKEVESEVRRWAESHNLPASLLSMDTTHPKQTFPVDDVETGPSNKPYAVTGHELAMRTGQVSRQRRARFRPPIPRTPSIDSLESFLNRPATLKKKPQPAHDAMLESICNVDFDLDILPSVLPSPPKDTSHDGASARVGRLKSSAGRLWARVQSGLGVRHSTPDNDDNGELEKKLDSDPKEPEEHHRRLFRFRFSSRLRTRAVTVFTAKMKERLYAAPETSETKREDVDEDDDEDDEEDEKSEQHKGRSLRANGAEVAPPDGRDQPTHGHWEWVEDDAIHEKSPFCFCFL